MSSTTSLFADQNWYAGAISERRCEEILARNGSPGAFLVRDYLLPGAEYNYILSVYSGREILHYDVAVFPTEECEFNGYSFTSFPEAIEFYTENRLQGHYLSLPEKPVVAEVVQRGMAPVTMATQPAPPPRSTPLQQPQLHEPTSQSLVPSSLSLEEGGSGVWGPASSGDTSAESYSPPLTLATHIPIGSPHNSQDVPISAPDTTSNELQPRVTEEDSEPKRSHNADSSKSPSSPFDDVTTFSTFHPAPGSRGESVRRETTPPPSQPQPPEDPPPLAGDESPQSPGQREKQPPPVPVRGSSVMQTTRDPLQSRSSGDQPHTGSLPEDVHLSPTETPSSGGSLERENESAKHRELKRLPSLKERKKQLEAQMAAASAGQSQSQPGEKPGRLVVNEALGGVAASMPATQHPLLVKKQEEMAARVREEREREQRERQAKEKGEREEKEKISRLFSFKRSGKGKREAKDSEKPSKEENRRSMTLPERDELQDAFKRVTQSRPTSPEPTSPPVPHSSDSEEPRERQQSPIEEREQQAKEEEVGKKTLKEEHLPALDPTPHPPPPQVKGSPRSNTLDRASKPPPLSSPPSLPGSIDRRIWHKRSSTLERPGSRPGTLERKTPLPPTSQPPPVPAEARREQAKPQRMTSVGSIGFSGGRMELADLIPGVSRHTLTGQSPSPSPSPSSSSSKSPQRRNTTCTNSSAGPINMKRSVKERKSTIKRGHHS